MAPRPLEIFAIAEQFYWTGTLAHEVLDDARAGNRYLKSYVKRFPNNMDAAGVACLAFSLELYFKCLIRIGRKPPARSHDLVTLFNEIGVRHQRAIRRYFYRHSVYLKEALSEELVPLGSAVPEPFFDYVLARSKDAFEIMRYLYEGLPPASGWLAIHILDGTRDHILRLHPDWRNVRQEPLLRPLITYHLSTSQSH